MPSREHLIQSGRGQNLLKGGARFCFSSTKFPRAPFHLYTCASFYTCEYSWISGLPLGPFAFICPPVDIRGLQRHTMPLSKLYNSRGTNSFCSFSIPGVFSFCFFIPKWERRNVGEGRRGPCFPNGFLLGMKIVFFFFMVFSFGVEI